MRTYVVPQNISRDTGCGAAWPGLAKGLFVADGVGTPVDEGDGAADGDTDGEGSGEGEGLCARTARSVTAQGGSDRTGMP